MAANNVGSREISRLCDSVVAIIRRKHDSTNAELTKLHQIFMDNIPPNSVKLQQILNTAIDRSHIVADRLSAIEPGKKVQMYIDNAAKIENGHPPDAVQTFSGGSSKGASFHSRHTRKMKGGMSLDSAINIMKMPLRVVPIIGEYYNEEFTQSDDIAAYKDNAYFHKTRLSVEICENFVSSQSARTLFFEDLFQNYKYELETLYALVNTAKEPPTAKYVELHTGLYERIMDEIVNSLGYMSCTAHYNKSDVTEFKIFSLEENLADDTNIRVFNTPKSICDRTIVLLHQIREFILDRTKFRHNVEFSVEMTPSIIHSFIEDGTEAVKNMATIATACANIHIANIRRITIIYITKNWMYDTLIAYGGYLSTQNITICIINVLILIYKLFDGAKNLITGRHRPDSMAERIGTATLNALDLNRGLGLVATIPYTMLIVLIGVCIPHWYIDSSVTERDGAGLVKYTASTTPWPVFSLTKVKKFASDIPNMMSKWFSKVLTVFLTRNPATIMEHSKSVRLTEIADEITAKQKEKAGFMIDNANTTTRIKMMMDMILTTNFNMLELPLVGGKPMESGRSAKKMLEQIATHRESVILGAKIPFNVDDESTRHFIDIANISDVFYSYCY
jgi:hypothetical protein